MVRPEVARSWGWRARSPSVPESSPTLENRVGDGTRFQNPRPGKGATRRQRSEISPPLQEGIDVALQALVLRGTSTEARPQLKSEWM